MKIVIATCTYYGNKELVRYRLACQTIRKAVSAGYEVAIVDNSPDRSIAEEFRRLGATVNKQSTRGMGPGRREVVTYAVSDHMADIVQWMEPEKDDFIRSIPTVTTKIKSGEVNIVHAGRTQSAWESYPAYQIHSEQKANRAYSELVGIPDFDSFFGPVAFDRRSALEFVSFDPVSYGVEDTYVQIFVPVYLHSRQIAKIANVKVDFIYPLEQRKEEEGILSADMLQKRQWQSDTIIEGVRKLTLL